MARATCGTREKKLELRAGQKGGIAWRRCATGRDAGSTGRDKPADRRKARAGTTLGAEAREAFDRAIAAYKDEPPRKRARVHEVYAEVLADRALPADAYEQAQKALKLQRT